MAFGWIMYEKGLNQKREVLSVASALDIEPEHAAGLCMRFWDWCDDNVPDDPSGVDGVLALPHVRDPRKTVDSVVGRQGFAEALCGVGWLKCEPDRVVLPNFCRLNLSTTKGRAVKRHRQADYRNKIPASGDHESDDDDATNVAPSAPPITATATEQKKKAAASQFRKSSGDIAGASGRKKEIFDAMREAAAAAAATGKDGEGYHAAVTAIQLIAGTKAAEAAARHASLTMVDVRNAADRIPVKFKKSKTAWWIWWTETGMYEAREQ